MKMKRYIGAAVAAFSLVTTSTAFAAAPVRPASVLKSASAGVVQRSGSKVNDSSELFGTPIIFSILAGIAVVAAVIVIADNDDSPTSP